MKGLQTIIDTFSASASAPTIQRMKRDKPNELFTALFVCHPHTR